MGHTNPRLRSAAERSDEFAAAWERPDLKPSSMAQLEVGSSLQRHYAVTVEGAMMPIPLAAPIHKSLTKKS